MHYVLALAVVIAVAALARWMRTREAPTDVVELPGPPCRATLTIGRGWAEFSARVPSPDLSDAERRTVASRLGPDASASVKAGVLRLRLGAALPEAERPRFIAHGYALVDRLTETRQRPAG